MAVTLDRVIRDYGDARKHHDKFVTDCDRRYRSYRGVLHRRSDAAVWTSKQHPPYVFQIVETICANMIDDRTSFRVRPRPFMADLETIAQRLAASKTLESVLRYEQDMDHFAEKQRPFALQASITGLSVAKVFWKYQQGMRTAWRPSTHEVMPGYHVPTMAPQSQMETIHDNATMEVKDVRDFIWHEAATDIQRSKYIFDRCWYSFDELKSLEQAGVYKNIDQLKESRDFSVVEGIGSREQDLFQRNRTKDQIEVIEAWYKDENRVVTMANRNVEIGSKDFPFWHGEYPFVTASTMPDLFQVPGVSDVELVEDLQEMLWSVMNQRLDNLVLLNNAIIILRSDVDDPEDFEFAPGAQWIVDDPSQVELWTPNPMPADVSISAENLIKGDIQNITGGMPFVAGDTSTVDQKTATGVSIVTNLAQRRLAAKKQNFANAFSRVANQEIQLLQQFMPQGKIIQVAGPDGNPDFVKVDRSEIQGRFHVEVEAVADSLMRQERRAEGQALLQLAAQVAPVMAAVGQPLNMRAFVEDWLRDYDKDDFEKYFSAVPQSPQQMQPGQQGGDPSQPPQGPGGVTAPQSIAPETSPSNQASMSPATFMQRLQAQQGGGGNNFG